MILIRLFTANIFFFFLAFRWIEFESNFERNFVDNIMFYFLFVVHSKTSSISAPAEDVRRECDQLTEEWGENLT